MLATFPSSFAGRAGRVTSLHAALQRAPHNSFILLLSETCCCFICNQVGQYIVPSGDQDGTAVARLGWRVPTLRLGRAMENKCDVSAVFDEEGAISLKTRMGAGEAWQLVDITVVSPVDSVFRVGGLCASGNFCKDTVENHICSRKTRTRRWVLALIAAAAAGVLLLLLWLDHRASAAVFESPLIPSRQPMTIAELYYPDVDFSGPYDPLLLGAPDRDVSLGAFGGVPARRYDFQLVKLKDSALDPGVLQLSASPVWYCWLPSDACLICSHDF